MRRLRALAAMLLLGAGSFGGLMEVNAQAQTSATPFQWPGGARLAVSLSYDDALNSQLDHALPALNAHGLRASFYLTLANPSVAQRLPEWRRAAAQGHELGNHTLYHPCSRSAAPGRDWVAPHRNLDTTSLAQQREEVLLANVFLQAIDGQSQRTFTLPCLDKLASGEPFLPAVKAAFVAIKARGGAVTADVTQADPHDIGSGDPSGLDGPALIAIAERAAADSQGRALLSLTFHGIGGDYLSVNTEAHEALLRHLAAHPERYWVDSFVNIMRRVRQR